MRLPSSEEIEDIKSRIVDYNVVINLGRLIPRYKNKHCENLYIVLKEIKMIPFPNGKQMLIAFPILPSDDKFFQSKDEFWSERELYYLIEPGCLLSFARGDYDTFKQVKFMFTPDMLKTGNVHFDQSPLIKALVDYNKAYKESMLINKFEEKRFTQFENAAMKHISSVTKMKGELIEREKELQKMRKEEDGKKDSEPGKNL